MKIAILIYCSVLLSQGNTQYQRTLEELSEQKTIKPITLDDIFITVKTTYKNHRSRLLIILRTWYQLAMNQVRSKQSVTQKFSFYTLVAYCSLTCKAYLATWFFTDKDDEVLQRYTRGHIVHTYCPTTHALSDLCCKTNVEYDTYLRSGKSWFCHFDDDVFVNVPRLLKFLQSYDHTQPWYFGKNYTNPIKIRVKVVHNKTKLWFPATFVNALGGGYCLSKSLAKKMRPYASHGKFVKMCEQTKRPEDQAIGYLVDFLLKNKLTVVSEFHTHFENMTELDPKYFHEQISFSYLLPHNVITVPGARSLRNDPTRFLSLFEFLFKLKVKATEDFVQEAMEPSNLMPTISKRFRIRKMLREK